VRQTVPLAESASTGQVALEPVHTSATSHAPAEARHDVPAVAKRATQLFDVPAQ
jgi:hypothetical protein